jgi:DNA-binding response OmpR family regulator
MPRIGGQDFLYAWRMGGETSGVPVIVISAESRALRPADLGVDAFLPKPFDIDKLLWHVRDLLALPLRAHAIEDGQARNEELADVVDDLSSAMSTLLIGVEYLADTLDLPENLRTIAAASLDAAQRVSALGHRLNHLIHAPL